MTRGILIAGNESPLFSALCAEAAKRVEKYAVTFIPWDQPPGNTRNAPADRQPAAGAQTAANRRIILEWNPASPVSAKALVLSAVNAMKHIDDAILVCVPPVCRKNVEDFSAEEINRFIDCNVKGWFFLVRELAAAFKARGKGTLSLALQESSANSGGDIPDLPGPAASSAFHSFAQGILLSSFNASYDVMGFSSSEPGEENAFAAFVFKIMEEEKRNSGKWHKYGKIGLFGR